MASWLDDLFGKQVQEDGVNVPMRKILNLIGATVEDNDSTGATDVTILGTAGYGSAKPSVAAKSNSGSTSYPALAAQAVGLSTFIRTAAADHDSIRMPVDADNIVPLTIGMQGRIDNLTSYIIDLYPSVGLQLGVDGVQQGANTPIEIPPFSVLFWMLDLDGTFYCVGA